MRNFPGGKKSPSYLYPFGGRAGFFQVKNLNTYLKCGVNFTPFKSSTPPLPASLNREPCVAALSNTPLTSLASKTCSDILYHISRAICLYL